MTSSAKLSRRGFLSGAMALPVLAYAGPAGASDSRPQTINPDKLVLIPSTAGNFDELLEASFPGLSQDPRFHTIRPVAVIVHNTAIADVRAFTATWSFTTSTGTNDTTLIHYTKPGTHRKGKDGKHHRSVRSGHAPVLKAGAVRLVTPFFNWTPAHYAKHKRAVWNKMLPRTASRKFLAQELTKTTAVQVTLGNVAFQGQHVPSTTDRLFFHHLDTARNAQHDEAVAVHRLVKAGATQETIVALLNAHRNGSKLKDRTNKIRYFYYVQRKHQANRLLLRLTKSPAKFNKHIERLVATKKSSMHKVKAA